MLLMKARSSFCSENLLLGVLKKRDTGSWLMILPHQYFQSIQLILLIQWPLDKLSILRQRLPMQMVTVGGCMFVKRTLLQQVTH